MKRIKRFPPTELRLMEWVPPSQTNAKEERSMVEREYLASRDARHGVTKARHTVKRGWSRNADRERAGKRGEDLQSGARNETTLRLSAGIMALRLMEAKRRDGKNDQEISRRTLTRAATVPT
ncbi:unnamed protein product [Caenorhabditis auriculariae]|uniref:Uncharacterized protein n=1 Tax=Caenorhabditis auriculariae TaxID=2777116 RepID=A0A8S1GRN3_9PELO|nr:unnamed protein product [Caenorhabditis auriculariae]